MIIQCEPPILSPRANHADDLIAVALAVRLIYQQVIDADPNYSGSFLMRAAIELESLAEHAEVPPLALS